MEFRESQRAVAPITVAVLLVAGLVVATLGTTPTRLGAEEILGQARAPGEPAFVAGHRGDSTAAPENTIPAVAAAISAGYDYVEVDVALTADGHPVLIHDKKVDRTTNGTGLVADLTLAEIRSLDAGEWFSAEFAGTRVPTLVEFLDVIGSAEHRAMIELKGPWTDVAVEYLVEEIEMRGLERSVILSSFDASTLGMVAAESSVISRLANLRRLPEDVAALAQAIGVHGVVANGEAVLEHPEFVEDARAAGLRIVLYTFNRDKQWQAALDLGVDGIVTDTPAELATWLDGVEAAE